MTASGSAYARFRRALQTQSVTLALTTAAELGRLDLEDAFELTLLLGLKEPPRFGRAAVRWHGRYCVERSRIELADAQFLLALLAGLRDQPTAAARGLEAFFAERGERKLAGAVRRWQVERQPTR